MVKKTLQEKIILCQILHNVFFDQLFLLRVNAVTGFCGTSCISAPGTMRNCACISAPGTMRNRAYISAPGTMRNCAYISAPSTMRNCAARYVGITHVPLFL